MSDDDDSNLSSSSNDASGSDELLDSDDVDDVDSDDDMDMSGSEDWDDGMMDDGDEDFLEEEEKPDAPDYEIISAEQVMQTPLKEMQKVNELFEITPQAARMLLSANGWNSEKLVGRYFNGEKAKLFQEAHIPGHLAQGVKLESNPDGTYECSVCFEDVDSLFAMPCAHGFCRDCYADYLSVKVNTEGNAAGITCPARGCMLQVDELTALKLLTETKTRDRYMNLIAKAYLRECGGYIVQCPGRDCPRFFKLETRKPQVIKCECLEEFCSGCGKPPHSPCDCKMLRQWQDKIQSDSESENWLKLYTRKCPVESCQATIVKDGGCQYVRCGVCNKTHCWLCRQMIDHKDHNCNALEKMEGADQAAKELAKWNHFSKRHAMHAQSLTFKEKLIKKSKALMAELENTHHKTWVEVQFVQDSLDTLLAARRVLKDTYIFGYFLPEWVNRELFEYLQAQLEGKTEELNSLLEKPGGEVIEHRLQIIDLEKTLAANLANVLEGLEAKDVIGGGGNAEEGDNYEQLPEVGYSGWVYKQNG